MCDTAAVLNKQFGRVSVDAVHRRNLFFSFVATQAISNLDTGACCVLFAFPAGQVTAEFDLSAVHVGAVGSVMYVGHTLGCFLGGSLIQRYHPKYLLICSLLLNVLCLTSFSLSSSFGLFIAARFVSGIVSALIVVYGPVWVDEFSDAGTTSLWLGLVQGGVAIGVMLGYVIAGFVMTNTHLSWRYFFQIQAALSLICATYFFFAEDRMLNHIVHLHIGTPTSIPRERRSRGHSLGALAANAWSVIRNVQYTLPLLSLCTLYFVVTGLQMWATSYLRGPPVHADLNVIIAAFGFCSATAPVLGVVFGGWVVDRLGGYKGRKHVVAGAATGFGVIACAASIASLAVDNIGVFAFFIWVVLFFGGAIVPCGVGLCIGSVPHNLRSIASGLCSCGYNLLGMFLGPFLGGAISDKYGVVWGFRAVMGSSGVAVVFMSVLTVLLYFSRKEVEQQLLQSQTVNETAAPSSDSDDERRSSGFVSPDSFHSTEVRRSLTHITSKCVGDDQIEQVASFLGSLHVLDIR